MKMLLIHLGGFEKKHKSFRMPYMTFPSLASVIPKHWDVEFCDQSFEDIDYGTDADIIGISILTANANQGYEIADRFRNKKKKFVVLGGYHATSLPEEALEHADAVVCGDGELALMDLLKDYEKGTNKKIYSKKVDDIDTLPFIDKSIMKPEKYIFPNTLQASRGCVNKCEFCDIRTVFPGYRMRSVKKVIEEIKKYQVGNFWQKKNTMLIDENIVSNRDFAKNLFRELKCLNIFWTGSCSFYFANDEELVRLAAESGCKGMFIGVESFNTSSLGLSNKKFNDIAKYPEWIKVLHDHGILIFAGIVLGFDEDDSSVFNKTLQSCINLGFDIVNVALLTPYPGTDLFKRLWVEGRILTRDWSKYDGTVVVFKPKKMSIEELQAGFNHVKSSLYKSTNIMRRLRKAPARNLVYSLMPNLSFQSIIRNQTPLCGVPDKLLNY